MAKRRKNKPGNPTFRPKANVAQPAKRAASPPPQFQLHVTASITPRDDETIETKMASINLPVTLSELAWEIANIAFSLGEELAFKVKMILTPDKPVKMDYEVDDDDIPF